MKEQDHGAYWFPAKRYGWGWGPPATWQGWVVLFAYIATVAFIAVKHPPHVDTSGFILGILVATVGLVIVCWWKGEPPRWRWGKDDD